MFETVIGAKNLTQWSVLWPCRLVARFQFHGLVGKVSHQQSPPKNCCFRCSFGLGKRLGPAKIQENYKHIEKRSNPKGVARREALPPLWWLNVFQHSFIRIFISSLLAPTAHLYVLFSKCVAKIMECVWLFFVSSTDVAFLVRIFSRCCFLGSYLS